MIKYYLVIALTLFALPLVAQDSWKIKYNKKTILNTSEEDETKNVKAVKPAWKKKDCLEVDYKQANPGNELIRSILIFDETDKEIYRKDDTRQATIMMPELQQISNGKSKLRIYTMAIPRDPNKAAVVRVRRVHLCTIELK